MDEPERTSGREKSAPASRTVGQLYPYRQVSAGKVEVEVLNMPDAEDYCVICSLKAQEAYVSGWQSHVWMAAPESADPMPGIVRKLVIFAAVDGLILQPSSYRSQRAAPSLQIRYTTQGTATLRPAPNGDVAHSASLEVHGIVYVVTSVALIPLSSQSEATRAIERTKEIQAESSDKFPDGGIASDTSADEGSYHSEGAVPDDNSKDSKALTLPYDPLGRKSQEGSESVAQDVIGRKGQYGRFAERWFSRKGWTSEHRKSQGMSADDMGKPANVRVEGRSESAQAGQADQNSSRHEEGKDEPTVSLAPQHVQKDASQGNDVISTLLPKLLRTTEMLFASRSFFYSYDYDITRRIGDYESKPSEAPLYRSVDPLFFWNQHLALPFIENGDHAYVLPLMQGFVGQRSFGIDSTPSSDPANFISKAEADIKDNFETRNHPKADSSFLLTLISRRSVERPGLRYLRRGVDDEGHTANSVETEQILSRASWSPGNKIFSFTQFRGSIPLFFSQSPYAFKPVPLLQHSFSTNHAAFKRHFLSIISRYGGIQIALLVDKHGGEAEIGQQYEEHVKRLIAEGGINGIKPGFEWFDFHRVCRGMQFENVSVLMDTLGDRLAEHGATVEMDGEVLRRQKGVLRTNCMDCLDRTNVVQSACGSRALERQLQEEGVEVDLQTDTTTQWFNTLWADNGDSISKQYSSTAALKGDYTRTRKRDYRGALNDFGLTLSRYYNNIVNDYFSQAAIDYLLGNVTEQVFEEFEADMMSNDPAISMRKVRANAIDVSSKIVIAKQSEDLIGGWTLLSPQEPNTVRTFPFQEVVLLLTNAAIYAVRFDSNLEKVSSFERVDLRSITGIIHGTYIISTLTTSQTDENKNIGLIIKYRPGEEDVARVNTRSLSTSVDTADPDAAWTATIANIFDPGFLPSRSSISKEAPLKFLAFKALPARSSLVTGRGEQENGTISERDLVSGICDDIKRAAYGNEGGGSDTGLAGGFLEENEIISLKEARRSTGYLEQWGHELKKLVWA
ncbi:MAG: hypothetical protein Q9179_002547 [Wetmoreana sp. 5 TL-2023]